MALCSADGRLYAAGGEDGNHRVLASMEMYDPDANVWTRVASMRQARRNLALAQLKPGILMAVGMIRREKGGD